MLPWQPLRTAALHPIFVLQNSSVDDNTNADGNVDLRRARQHLGGGPRRSVTTPNCAMLRLYMRAGWIRVPEGSGRTCQVVMPAWVVEQFRAARRIV